MFAPASNSSISRRRTREPLIEYSPVPSRKTARSIETSSKSILKILRELSKMMATEARFALGVVCDPPQIRSSARFPRMLFIDCSPSAKRKASATLLLPDPFGPTIAVVELEKSKTVFLANDLNPTISSRFNIHFSITHKNTLLVVMCSLIIHLRMSLSLTVVNNKDIWINRSSIRIKTNALGKEGVAHTRCRRFRQPRRDGDSVGSESKTLRIEARCRPAKDRR